MFYFYCIYEKLNCNVSRNAFPRVGTRDDRVHLHRDECAVVAPVGVLHTVCELTVLDRLVAFGDEVRAVALGVVVGGVETDERASPDDNPGVTPPAERVVEVQEEVAVLPVLPDFGL